MPSNDHACGKFAQKNETYFLKRNRLKYDRRSIFTDIYVAFKMLSTLHTFLYFSIQSFCKVFVTNQPIRCEEYQPPYAWPLS